MLRSEEGSVLVVVDQRGDELRLAKRGLIKKKAGLSFASGSIVNNFGWDEIVMFDLGTHKIGQTDGIGLGTGSDLNFSNEMLRDQHTDVVTKVGF